MHYLQILLIFNVFLSLLSRALSLALQVEFFGIVVLSSLQLFEPSFSVDTVFILLSQNGDFIFFLTPTN